MPRTPEQYEEIRKEKKHLIMDAALELFANNGYTSTSISQIAEKANISKGLMYNYFSSKEELLQSILDSLSDEIIEMIDPNHDDQITEEEALQFFDLFFEMLKKRHEQIKLYYQISVQPQVVGFMREKKVNPNVIKQQQLIFDFMLRRSNIDPMFGIINISSLIKGFSLQYVFAPEMFPDDLLENYKEYLKNTLIRNK
jgi:AcrR family transcriptional regulator